MSKLNVDTIEPEGASTTLTLGASGDTVTIPSGATIDASAATATGFAAGLNSVQVFTSSGTWTRPSGITKVIMEVQGAGGSGCAHVNYNNGAAGGYAKKLLDVSSISTSTITTGAGGAAVAANGGVGNDGGLSSWADGTNTVTGNGGPGGSISAGIAVAGGTGVGGSINIQGGYGGSSSYGAGASMFGFGRFGSGKDGVGYGSGGSQGYTSYASGAGTGGIVIVWEYK
jgi:hypothetical protein